MTPIYDNSLSEAKWTGGLTDDSRVRYGKWRASGAESMYPPTWHSTSFLFLFFSQFITGLHSDCLVKAPQFPGFGLGLDFLFTWKASLWAPGVFSPQHLSWKVLFLLVFTSTKRVVKLHALCVIAECANETWKLECHLFFLPKVLTREHINWPLYWSPLSLPWELMVLYLVRPWLRPRDHINNLFVYYESRVLGQRL